MASCANGKYLCINGRIIIMNDNDRSLARVSGCCGLTHADASFHMWRNWFHLFLFQFHSNRPGRRCLSFTFIFSPFPFCSVNKRWKNSYTICVNWTDALNALLPAAVEFETMNWINIDACALQFFFWCPCACSPVIKFDRKTAVAMRSAFLRDHRPRCVCLLWRLALNALKNVLDDEFHVHLWITSATLCAAVAVAQRAHGVCVCYWLKVHRVQRVSRRMKMFAAWTTAWHHTRGFWHRFGF